MLLSVSILENRGFRVDALAAAAAATAAAVCKQSKLLR